jgi:hypothetical protein
MPLPMFWQPTELQSIPAHARAAILFIAASGSMRRLRKGQRYRTRQFSPGVIMKMSGLGRRLVLFFSFAATMGAHHV